MWKVAIKTVLWCVFQRMETFWHWILVEPTSACCCAECVMATARAQVAITMSPITSCMDQQRKYVYVNYCVFLKSYFVLEIISPVFIFVISVTGSNQLLTSMLQDLQPAKILLHQFQKDSQVKLEKLWNEDWLNTMKISNIC